MEKVKVEENKTEKKNKPMFLYVLVVILLGITLYLYFTNCGVASTTKISETQLKTNVETFVDAATGQTTVVHNVTESNGLYKIIMTIGGTNYVSYATFDGKLLFASAMDMTQEITPTPAPKAVPKTDKPKVELFIWGYCPYGIQVQGPLAEVASLLKGKADFSAVLYYDGHGVFETQQNKIQECVQKLYADKYWNYAAGFVKDIYPICSSLRTEECDKTESIKLMVTLGIDSTKILNCVNTEGEALIKTASQRASNLGVTGSPTIVINGVITNPANRTANALKDSVCGAFNTPPQDCSRQISTQINTSNSDASCG